MKRIQFLLVLLAFIPMSLFAQQPVDSNKSKPGIVAHRGFHRFEGSAENSISALRQAVAHDFEGSEFDVQLTSDDVAIVFHDGSMQGHVISETPFDTLRQLPAFTLKSDETVPTLDAFLGACRQALLEQQLRETHTRLFFEIKPQTNPVQRHHLIGQIIETIGKYQLHDAIFFISFDLEACMMMAQLMPNVPVAYLEGKISPEELYAKGVSDLDYHWHYLLEHPEWVEEAHNLGMTVNAWTVNDPVTAKKMLNLGVDFITTDEPLKMREWLDQAMTE